MSLVVGRARRRALSVTAAVAGLALLVGGCGGGTDESTSADKANSGKNFPVTIESALGEAEITEQPERIVTLGQGSTETAIALGHTPVGMERYDWGSDKSGHLPWVREAVKKRGDDLPEQFAGGESLDIEAVLKLEPDLILAPWSGITQDQYDLLKDIAPTVAYPDKAWSTEWDEQIKLIAKALGKPGEGDKLIRRIEKQLSDAAESRPEYENVTFSYIYTTGPGTLGVFKPTEQRVEMLSSLGLKVDPVVKTFKETEGTDSALIGLENAHKLSDSDIVFTFYTDEKTRKEIEAQPLYKAIPAVEKGAVVHSDDHPFVTASSMINPLTVPWSIERYLPLIDKAVEKTEQ